MPLQACCELVGLHTCKPKSIPADDIITKSQTIKTLSKTIFNQFPLSKLPLNFSPLQTHSEHQWDQDRRGQSQSLGPPVDGEEAAL